jgi:glycosyltransferase involved in cell wall biosynthesis
MPTIYIDCTCTCTSPISTGIQRVVRNIARHAPDAGARHGYQVKLVALQNDQFCEIDLSRFKPPNIGAAPYIQAMRRAKIRCLRWVDALRGMLSSLVDSPTWRGFINAPRYRFGLARCALLPISIPLHYLRKISSRFSDDYHPLPDAPACHTDDLLLLADSTWDSTEIWPAVRRFRSQGGYVASIFYDLIPLTHPHFCHLSLVNAFRHWIDSSTQWVDLYICISHTAELDLQALLNEAHDSGGGKCRANTSYFHLGSDLDLMQLDKLPDPKLVKIATAGGPIFLVVGTIEPRKNLTYLLDAFAMTWAETPQARLVIVGHNIVRSEDLIKRIYGHPKYGTGLFWLRDAGDNDLEYLYQRANALVFPSLAEGFGLPIVEAMQRGLPVICSDIPVFREIADGCATFIDPFDPTELADAVRSHLQANLPRTVLPWPSWKDSVGQLIDGLVTNHRDRRQVHPKP